MLSLAVRCALEAAIDDFEKPDSGVRAVLIHRAQGKRFAPAPDLGEGQVAAQRRARSKHFIPLRPQRAAPARSSLAHRGGLPGALVLAGGTS